MHTLSRDRRVYRPGVKPGSTYGLCVNTAGDYVGDERAPDVRCRSGEPRDGEGS